jgi:hypothetical protein
VPRLADRKKDPFVTCPAVLPAPYGELPALLPASPVFLLSGPAVSVEPGSAVHWSLQSPAPACGRTEKILVNILGFLRIRQEKDSAKGGRGKKEMDGRIRNEGEEMKVKIEDNRGQEKKGTQ